MTENAQQHGLNTRVINLAYGTDSTQDHLSDPLAYAVDQAWRKGIVVVVAAGNDGTTKEDLADPAVNPNILAVGASDPNGTLQTGDDTLAAFSDRGTKKRYADVVAPGTHVLGLRVPDGLVDQANPSSRVGTRYTRGSGTSQAAAVVSGAAALLLSAYPTLTPNQVKGALQATAGTPPLDTPKPKKMGAGITDVAAATAEIATAEIATAGPAAHAATLTKRTATGTGTLERARGSAHVVDAGTALTGERDIFGRPWTADTWATSVNDATSWSQGRWNGSTWTGTSWTEHTRDTSTWAGGSWDGRNWGDASWAGTTWTGRLWASFAWS